jgi:hypothetical protein
MGRKTDLGVVGWEKGKGEMRAESGKVFSSLLPALILPIPFV